MKKNIQTSWNFKLLYKNDSDPQIEKDLVKIETACVNFEKKYRATAFTSSPEALATAYEDREKLSAEIDASKPWWYFALKNDINSEDKKATALSTKYEQRITEATNRIKFFGLEIAKITPADQKKFLENDMLKPYYYSMERIFNHAKYNLSEGEEQLEDLLSQTSYTMWITTQQKLLNQQAIKHKGKNIPIVKASGELADMPKKDREEVHQKINHALKSISHVAEGEINAVYNYKKIMDDRRGYEKPYSATILGYENDEKSIENFIALVSKNFKIAHKFYKIHAKFLGEKKISMAHRGVKIGQIKTKFDFNTSVSILRSVLGKFDKEYLDIFDSFLENGQIDVLPKKGKQGGAYCWGRGQLPTFVLLNHTNNVRSLETLAHEMGHAIHTELSKKQPSRYRGHSTATAEVASTFFEQLIAEEIGKHLSEKEKVTMLHNRLMGDVVTIFLQIACFNFELELHKQIRATGGISKEEIADMLSGHFKSFFGAAVSVTHDDGYFFVRWSHIRRFFYVYSYAYGQIISRALYEKWKQDPSYAVKIREFLSAGRSMSPEDIFKSIGIDTSKTAFFEAGLKGIEKDIEKLEKFAKNR